MLYEWPVRTQTALVPVDLISRLQCLEFWDKMDLKNAKALYLPQSASLPRELNGNSGGVGQGKRGLRRSGIRWRLFGEANPISFVHGFQLSEWSMTMLSISAASFFQRILTISRAVR